MKRKLIISALTALLIMCVCALAGCSGRTTVDFKDYVQASFEGYNGSGRARIDVNYKALSVLLNGTSAEELFEWEMIPASNGELSNGDTVKIKMQYNELLMKNAKIKIKNPELTFNVSGLPEKEKLDIFAKVKLETLGTSPECAVSVEYDGGEGLYFEVQSDIGTPIEWIVYGDMAGAYGGKLKNGDKITVKLADNGILEELREKYIIEETSREYTVQSDSSYILTAADLSPESRQTLDKIAEDFLSETTESLANGKSDSDRKTRIDFFSSVAGLNRGTLYAGYSYELEISPSEFNSAYVGVGEVSDSWGSSKTVKSIYYIYEADISYTVKPFASTYSDSATCALIVRIDDPRITPEGVMYSDLTFLSAKDFQTAYSKYVSSKFEKM